MTSMKIVLTIMMLSALLLVGIQPEAIAQETKVTPPQPTVPEIFTLEGQYVRVAYNNEGFATLGYRTTQNSQGQDWVLLNAGITLRKGNPNQKLERTDITLKIPDGKIVPLATRPEFNEAGYCAALVKRDSVVRDSINYFPADVDKPCALGFFGQPGTISYDEVELSSNRACVSRLFFKVPGGIVPGQYWLNIKFDASEVQVPFRVLTKEEEKELGKKWEDIKEAHDESMKKE